ncbi:hypothetical protein MNB_SV-12-253 [hydrothermal vent metagenome]|uniref:Mobile element protein n=1 Tax=hydrothermal vent metagenome TaxID=652676 RepID=A0A1W1BFT9_9ZZZZ
MVLRKVFAPLGEGKQYCPVEKKAKIIKTATPKFAKIVSNKYAHAPAKAVQKDLEENHNREISRSFIRSTSQIVSNLLLKQEENWEYEIAEMDKEVATISMGLDGTCMPMGETSWREAMCGTFSFYDINGERMQTIYIANAPEYGKQSFKEKFDKEALAIKKKFPKAKIVGVADGARENWSLLEKYTVANTLDYYHATEYLTKASKGVHPRSKSKREAWYQKACDSLKNVKNGANNLLEEIKELKNKKLSLGIKDGVDATITYFTNNLKRMNYKDSIDNKLPIGSGVTESACKIVVKQRVCVSGANWSEYGAKRFLPIRAICLTEGRWNQAWDKFMEDREMVA